MSIMFRVNPYRHLRVNVCLCFLLPYTNSLWEKVALLFIYLTYLTES